MTIDAFDTIRMLDSAEQTRQLGRDLARTAAIGDVFLLHGDLGAGKTTLTHGMASALGIEDAIQSPTFTLVREHRGRAMTLYHLDLFRLTDPDELETMGYETYIDPVDGISVIEWPERAGDWLPARYTVVSIEHAGGDRRRVTVSRHGHGPHE